MSTGPDRLDFALLLDWLEGRLDPGTAGRVAARVAGADPRTRRTVDWLRGFLETARTLRLHQPPRVVRQSLAQYFARWSLAQAELEQKPPDMQARLLFDSRRDLALAGVRTGSASEDAVHLAYTAEAGDLLLDVYQAGAGRIRVDGQVLAAGPQGAPIFEASVTGPGFTVRTRDGDELGRFSLRDVPGARCQLRATNGLVTIVADLDLDPGGDQP